MEGGHPTSRRPGPCSAPRRRDAGGSRQRRSSSPHSSRPDGTREAPPPPAPAPRGASPPREQTAGAPAPPSADGARPPRALPLRSEDAIHTLQPAGSGGGVAGRGVARQSPLAAHRVGRRATLTAPTGRVAGRGRRGTLGATAGGSPPGGHGAAVGAATAGRVRRRAATGGVGQTGRRQRPRQTRRHGGPMGRIPHHGRTGRGTAKARRVAQRAVGGHPLDACPPVYLDREDLTCG
eukprot:TRINITY_DN291_c0_g1_i6.p1 TRINITY_DN291_c0_g1~~TRINITY_DN291_c0_g1_i6.p1  ORF type:complete len:255 (-),score=13.50 TRINITY_DN291_c0_g1_i6:956-1663(-)